MAVTLKGQTAVYEGVSTDTKPTDADNNAIFKELDTGIRYYYDGTDWNEIPSSGGGGGTGTDNYNELNNKPSINGTVLSGNKSLDNLGIQAKLTFDSAPTEDSENPVESGGVYGALAGKQDTISDLSAIRSGAAAGATAVQPDALETALAQKQDALSSEQLDAVNSGVTSADVEQITTNKNNISYNSARLVDTGAKNVLDFANMSKVAGTATVVKHDGDSITVTSILSSWVSAAYPLPILPAGTYTFSALISDYSSSGGAVRIIVAKTVGGQQEVGGKTLTANGKINFNFVSSGEQLYLLYYPNYSNSNYINSFTASQNMLCTAEDYDISHEFIPYAMGNAKLTNGVLLSLIMPFATNNYNVSNLGVRANANIDTSTGIITQTVTDTHTYLRFQMSAFNGNTLVRFLTEQIIMTNNGVYCLTFTKSSDYNTLVFGHNGSAQDFKVTLPISALSNGDYILKINILNCIQANGAYSFNDIAIVKKTGAYIV